MMQLDEARNTWRKYFSYIKLFSPRRMFLIHQWMNTNDAQMMLLDGSCDLIYKQKVFQLYIIVQSA